MNTSNINTKFLELKDELFAYLLGFLKNNEDAEDALQDLYLKIWSKRKMINQKTAKYYFFRAARNLGIDQFRRKKRENQIEFSLQYELGHDITLEKEELSLIFRAAVERLPPASREVIFLTDICHMNTKEVVEITKSNSNNVRVNLSRARAKVSEELEEIYKYQNTGIAKN